MWGLRVCFIFSFVKRIRLGCSLSYDVVAPTGAFTFNVFPTIDGEQRIVTESIVCTPDIPAELITSARGDRLLRVEVPAGRFELRYTGSRAGADHVRNCPVNDCERRNRFREL